MHSGAPIEIQNNMHTVVRTNKKFFLEPGNRLLFVHESYKDMNIEFEANINERVVHLKRKQGKVSFKENLRITSINKGFKEFIYLGQAPVDT